MEMSINDVAEKINELAAGFGMAEFQSIRKTLKGLKTTGSRRIFDKRSVFEDDSYAYHYGGRTEIQYNIGYDEVWHSLRFGLAFSLETSRSLYDVSIFRPKIARFNRYLAENPRKFSGLYLCYWADGEWSEVEDVKTIDDSLIQKDVFIFIGNFIDKQLSQLTTQDYEEVLTTFDELLDVYRYVEGEPEKTDPNKAERVTGNLSTEAEAVLRVILDHIGTQPVEADRPDTFIGYKQVHDLLRLPLVRKTYGDSLIEQGLGELAEWTSANGFPAVTGLVIDSSTFKPGKGYYNLFKKDPDDFAWWQHEIEKALAFDWERYLTTAEVIENEAEVLSSEIDYETPQAIDFTEPTETARVLCHTYRVLRDTKLARRIKSLHRYKCQICGQTIKLKNAQLYAEAHHIKPLGSPHNGPDEPANVLCVCPNHHVELDYGAIQLKPDRLTILPQHNVGDEYINYHNTVIFARSEDANNPQLSLSKDTL